MTVSGLIGMAGGSATLPMMPVGFGVLGYIAPLVVITAGYALFQAANNTAVMTQSRGEQRGVISGLLNLSRNLGLITGASVMGMVFALGSATVSSMAARPGAVVAGMRPLVPPSRAKKSCLKIMLRTKRMGIPPSPSPEPPRNPPMPRPPSERRSSRSALLPPGVHRM